MNMVPFLNETSKFLHIGGVTIPPGEVRDVDPRLLPDYEAPKASEAPGDDPLLAILALSVAKLAAGLPDLSDDELLRLEAMEQAKDKPRVGALAEITQERLRRAELQAPGGLESTDETGDQSGDGGSGE